MIKSRRMRWTGHAARMGETRNAYRILVGKPEEERPLGRQRRRWVDNITIDLREIGWGCMIEDIGIFFATSSWTNTASFSFFPIH
jgi:hypothetical protein